MAGVTQRSDQVDAARNSHFGSSQLVVNTVKRIGETVSTIFSAHIFFFFLSRVKLNPHANESHVFTFYANRLWFWFWRSETTARKA